MFHRVGGLRANPLKIVNIANLELDNILEQKFFFFLKPMGMDEIMAWMR